MRFFLLFTFLLFISCLSSPPIQKEEIVIGIETYPQEMDPRKTVEALPSKIFKLIYSGLFKFNDNLELVPDLVDSYQWNANALEVKLKRGILFHDESLLTANDVAATFESLKVIPTPYASLWDDLQKIEIIADNQLHFIFKKRTPLLLTQLTFPILKITPNQIEFKPIGTGPYQFESSVINEKITLNKFEHYFGGVEKVKNKHLVFRTIMDDTLRALELMKGRLDMVQNAIAPVLVGVLEKEKNLALTQGDGINFSYIGFNLKNKFLNNVKVRQAIARAIPRDDLIHYKMNDLATLATSILYPRHWAFNKELQPTTLDVEAAKKLLDEAGFIDPDGDGPKPRFSITYKTSTKKDRVDMAQIIAEYLRQIGIEVLVKPYEWGTFFYDIRTGNFDMYSLTMVGVTDPDIYYTSFHSSQLPPAGRNRGYYSNAQLDKLLDAGRLEMEEGKRKIIYAEVQKIIFDESAIIPLWYEKNYVMFNKNITGYTVRPDAGFQGLMNVTKTNP